MKKYSKKNSKKLLEKIYMDIFLHFIKYYPFCTGTPMELSFLYASATERFHNMSICPLQIYKNSLQRSEF